MTVGYRIAHRALSLRVAGFRQRPFSRMALNAASHNIPGEQTGPATGQPPSVPAETAAAIVDASQKDPVGQQAPGRDGGDKDAGKKVKSEKERV